jgi:hypothetical protein
MTIVNFRRCLATMILYPALLLLGNANAQDPINIVCSVKVEHVCDELLVEHTCGSCIPGAAGACVGEFERKTNELPWDEQIPVPPNKPGKNTMLNFTLVVCVEKRLCTFCDADPDLPMIGDCIPGAGDAWAAEITKQTFNLVGLCKGV